MSAYIGFDFTTAVVGGDSHAVTPAGLAIPRINPGALTRWGTRTAGEQPTLASTALVLDRLVFPPGSPPDERINYVAYALKEVALLSPKEIIEALGNLAEQLVPGCMGVMFDCRVNDVAVDATLFRIYGTQHSMGGQTFATLADALQEINALPADDQWGNFSLTPVLVREATALFALCAYCVVKAPTALNQTAFTASRPLAAARASGLASYPAHLLPAVSDLVLINNALQSDRRARVPFATCLVSWATTRSVNAQQAAMASQASLWRDQGFGGLKLTRSLILSYGPALQRVNRLAGQLVAFQEHWRAYDGCNSPIRAYYGAIYGPTNPIAARDDYSTLTLLARDIVQESFAAGRGMRNFGAGRSVPEDIRDAFRDACLELGLALPAI